MRFKNLVCASTTGLLLPGGASGAEYFGPGRQIPNLNEAHSEIVVPDHFLITDVNVTVNSLFATWVGDLQFRLVRSATSATLLNRIGVPPGAGDSSDFNGDYTFDSDGTNNIWTAAAGVAAAGVVPPGTYMTSGPASGGVNNFSLDMFDGQDAAGTWTLIGSNHAGSDFSNFGGWTLTIVPEPSRSWLLVIGLVFVIQRR
ncbi:MAG: hypothetical protein SF069_12350 [Phycisphaerae bacterium]|nr:hypothetical protein [Phycisphaerae bacterium]